jgi:hypothetical protein
MRLSTVYRLQNWPIFVALFHALISNSRPPPHVNYLREEVENTGQYLKERFV